MITSVLILLFCRSRAVDHPAYPSVLTALEFDNSVVANCLIDMRGIETILLIKVRFNFSTSNTCKELVFLAARPAKS